MNRESFVFYASWLDAIKNLPREMQGEVLVAIVEYGITGEMLADLKPITKALMAMVKPQIDINRAKYENGKKGGRKASEEPKENQTETKPKPNRNQTETKPKPNRNQTETKPKPNQTKPEPNDNVNVYVNDNKEKECKKKNVRFSPPTLEEIKQFIAENGLCVNAEKFFYYYESQDWKVGRTKMKDWKAKVQSWHHSDLPNQKAEVGMILRDERNKYDNDEELWNGST